MALEEPAADTDRLQQSTQHISEHDERNTMMRRGGRPGLMGTMARTAVIAGTATVVSGGASRRQQARAQSAADQQAAQQRPQQPQHAAPAQECAQAPQPAAAADDSLSAQIERLATLKPASVITDAEFSPAKAKLLGI